RDEDRFAAPLPAHPVPGLDCGCGFHAAKDRAAARTYLRGRDEPGTVARILGQVALWGHVVETEGGWRASHAYPARLLVDDPRLAKELVVYGVPLGNQASSGRWPVTVVPLPAGLTTKSVPPAASARSRKPRMPEPAAGSAPRRP